MSFYLKTLRSGTVSIIAVSAALVATLPMAGAGKPDDDKPVLITPGTRLQQSHGKPEQIGSPAGGGSAKGKPGGGGGGGGTSIPLWSYSITAYNGTKYSGTMVGKSPFTDTTTTTIPTVIIPVQLNFRYSTGTTYTFDPAAADAGCLGSASATALSLTQNSPIFQPSNYTLNGVDIGSGQYIDAYQRANFWSSLASQSGYHTVLGVTTAPLQSVTISASNSGNPAGTVYTMAGQCGSNVGNTNMPGALGVVNINSWDSMARSILSHLGIGADKFPLFLFYNAVMSTGAPTNLNTCCVLGYHTAVGSQTYAVAEFEGRNQTLFSGTADVSVLAHEVGEWMDDPLVNNSTPSWGHTGQVSTCQANLENGDPLSGTLFPTISMNGFNYHPQELAFYNWFFGGNPPLGTGSWYSNNGTFTTRAAPCP